MATVTDRSRGQLILVGALGLAVTLVLLALVLNSAIYTENLASRNLDSDGDAIDTQKSVTDGLGGLMDAVNDPSTPTGYSTLEDEYMAGVGTWNVEQSRLAALDARSVRVSNASGGNSISRGVRVVDANASSTLTPRNGTTEFTGADDWVVASDVRVRSFRLNISDGLATENDGDVRDELDDGTWTEGSFLYVDIDDGDGNEWRLAVYDDGSDFKLGVYDGATGTYSTCAAPSAATSIRIDVGRGTVNNVPCEALSTVADQAGAYTVRFANGEQAEGTYELTADRLIESETTTDGAFGGEVDRLNFGVHCSGDSSSDESTYWAASAGEYPTVTPALYSSEATVNVREGDLEFDSTVRIAADELSEGVESPKITSIEVDDTSDGTDAIFTVTADVSDPDGDLDEVEVTVDRVGGSEWSEVEPVSGSEANDVSVSRTSGGNDGEEFEITVKVTDNGGNSRSVTQYHKADGGTDGGACPQ